MTETNTFNRQISIKNNAVSRRSAFQRGLLLVTVILAALLLTACDGSSGEATTVATPAPTFPAESGFPLSPPDLEQGATLYAEHCTECHGLGGKGDGPLVGTDELTNMPSDFTDPATLDWESPLDWFTVITQGQPDKQMPAWYPDLSEAERWAVALFAYTLNHTPQQIAEGQAVWLDHCSECHGDTGRGDGPRAKEINRPIGNLTRQSEIITFSDSALFSTITEGIGDTMPAFMDDLTPDEIRAAVAYIRTLTVASADLMGQPVEPLPPSAESTAEATVPPAGKAASFAIAQVATAEANSAPTATIHGTVTNGTALGSVPPDLAVRLLVSSGAHTNTYETTIDAAQGYTFTDIPLSAGNQYAVAALYRDRIFSSEVVTGDPTVPEMQLPLTIYELTEDPTVIDISSILIQANILGDTMEVRQAFRFRNNSDRLLTSSEPLPNGRFASVAVKLPPGAQTIQLDETGRFVLTDDGTTLVDTQPVVPGDGHVMLVIYLVPYDNVSAVIEQELTYPLDGEVHLMIWPQSLEVSSDQLAAAGTETQTGITYQSFTGNLKLSPGDVLQYTLRGAAASAVENVSVTTQNDPALPLILILVGGAVAVGGAALYLRGRTPGMEGARQRAIDSLLAQVAELDRQHQSGELNHDLWHRQRAALKARLTELMGEAQPEDEE
ncbi:MAG: c-type cytochrome [Anaerolineaceae bacterium]|nr:c-type cytochrome [Anaerolineaceae bacterium]